MLTPEQVLALAPDASSAKAAQALAQASKWVELGIAEVAVWGLVQGSGARPYAAAVDLGGPAFECSCPSRKSPCKHALGLMLLAARDDVALQRSEPPEWVRDWMVGRTRTSERRQERAAKSAAKTPRERDPETLERRDARVQTGLEELALWLTDLVRSGLADARSKPTTFWTAMAARLVDAQAPGLARRVRELGDLVSSGEGWHERMLHRAARLQLAIEGFSRLEHLPAELRADLRAELGFTTRQQELIETATRMTDAWHVVGRRVEESLDENLKYSRVWLRGERSERMALVLSFAAGSKAVDTSLLPGMVVDMDLVFFPGSRPLRAVVAERRASRAGASLGNAPLPGEALQHAAVTMAQSPWLDRVPVTVRGVSVTTSEARDWSAVAPQQPRIALGGASELGWSLLAVTGGRPATLFGEWNGERLRVMSVELEGRMCAVRVGSVGPWLVRVAEQVAA